MDFSSVKIFSFDGEIIGKTTIIDFLNVFKTTFSKTYLSCLVINSNNEDVYVYKSPSGSVYTQPLAPALLTETFFAKSEAWNSQPAKTVARSRV